MRGANETLHEPRLGVHKCPCWQRKTLDIAPMKVQVVVKPKEAVLDPQGAAVRDAMHHLGMPEVRSVRIGKFMEIELEGGAADLEKRLHGLCRDLLSNPVIEDYQLEKMSNGKEPK